MHQAGTQGRGFPAPSAPDTQPPAPLASRAGPLPRCSLPGVPSTQHRSGDVGQVGLALTGGLLSSVHGRRVTARDRGTSAPLSSECLLSCLTLRRLDRWSTRLPRQHPRLMLRVKAQRKRALPKGAIPPGPQGMESPGAALPAHTDCSSVEPHSGALRVRGA